MQVTILGDGSFGTALAQLCARNNLDVKLWCHNPLVADSIKNTGYNTVYMPGLKLHTAIKPTISLKEALSNSSWIVEAIPVAYLRSVLLACKPMLDPSISWVLASKGMERDTGYLPSEILTDALGIPHFVVLSGPSFAQELFTHEPTALTLASPKATSAHSFKTVIEQKNLVLECSADYLGAQWCGALKNVIALAVGMIDGAGYGANSQALVCARMVQELTALITSSGGHLETIVSFAGIGDIALTAYSSQSRNKALGKALGMKEYLEKDLPYTEGINTLAALPLRINITAMPMFHAVHKIVFEGHDLTVLFEACKKHESPKELML